MKATQIVTPAIVVAETTGAIDMTAFWFSFCMYPSPDFDEGFGLASCQFVTQAECEAVFDECFAGFVPTPVRRAK